MEEIDWSKAPEGTTHYQKSNHEFFSAWIRANGDGTLDAIMDDGIDFKWGMAGYLKDKESFLIPRPTQSWTGTGLPPVGVVCEYQLNDVAYEQKWVKVKPKYFGKELIVLEHACSGNEYIESLSSCNFRQLPTPEQIAAQERAQAIEKMWSVYWQPSAPTAKEALGLLWDAGLRFQDDAQ